MRVSAVNKGRIDPPNKDTILSSLIKPETFTSEQAMSKSNETKRMGFRILVVNKDKRWN